MFVANIRNTVLTKCNCNVSRLTPKLQFFKRKWFTSCFSQACAELLEKFDSDSVGIPSCVLCTCRQVFD